MSPPTSPGVSPSHSGYFPTSSSSTSYIYPVRSLLSGIQPALDPDALSASAPTPTTSNTTSTSPSNSNSNSNNNSDSTLNPTIGGGSDASPRAVESRDYAFGSSDGQGQGQGQRQGQGQGQTRRQDRPNRRDPIEIGNTMEFPPPTPASRTEDQNYFPSEMFTTGSTRRWAASLQQVPSSPPTSKAELSDSKPFPVRDDGAVAPDGDAGGDNGKDEKREGEQEVPKVEEEELEPRSRRFSLASSDIVRLPPSNRSTAGSLSSRSSAMSGSFPRSRRTSDRVDGHLADNEYAASSSAAASKSESGGSSSGTGPVMTRRFEHKTTEDGHHVIVGREGTLERCEDEPIKVPGAVQGFGVMVVCAEDEETGHLCVRQVSENAAELLGLSPKYLFSLECFTQTLPESQADVLWDNVQYLYDLESDAETSNSNGGGGNGGGDQDSPQIFLLSGWGEPGSEVDEDGEKSEVGDEHGRREWTCWCAAHRPAVHRGGGSRASSRGSEAASVLTGPSLLVLEFELERDVYNPLYPPFGSQAGTSGSGEESPRAGSGGSGRSSSLESGGGSSGGRRGSTPGSSGTERGGGEREREDVMGEKDSTPKDERVEMLGGGTELVSGGGQEPWEISPEDILQSTTNHAKPLKALERMRRVNRQAAARATAELVSGGAGATSGRGVGGSGRGTGGVSTMDVFALLAQVDDQWGKATSLDAFLKIVVGIVKDLTQFHRVLVYQFDESWNGQVVAELMDWHQTHDMYKGLHFPASDIPPQARQLYAINKVRLLYDRSQVTARLVVRSKADLDPPLDMTHSYLRAMSPIHIKYLGNMGVRASMSISIMAFGQLWGLIACHSYGLHGMRVSFPVRQLLRLMSDSISRNIERLSYAQRLHTRKLISTLPTDEHPTGYIVSNAEDLLGLFDADFGILVIGDGAKILGPNHSGQEILIMAEYLRLKQFNIMQVSQAVVRDFPDLKLPTGLDAIAGLLYIPLSSGGKDFIAFLRKGQLKDVHWAGKPRKEEGEDLLAPRTSFKTWSETISGRCRAWTDEQLETAGVLALVYGKFIEVWRQKESALKTTQLTALLLSNASHEVRTPLNHIINYLELALNGPLDPETRENLRLSHTASKSLLFTINDLLDLTRLESGNETSFNEPFDLPATIGEAVQLYRIEAERRELVFQIDTSESPQIVVGDARKIRTVVANLTANAVKYTTNGTITVECRTFKEPVGLRDKRQVAIEIVVGDTGCGIPANKLESIFRQFEQVESSDLRAGERDGLGLGLAVVARIVEQLGGQLRVDSKVEQGSRFSFLIPFALPGGDSRPVSTTSLSSRGPSPTLSTKLSLSSRGSAASQIDSLVEALQANHMRSPQTEDHRHPSHAGSLPRSQEQTAPYSGMAPPQQPTTPGEFEVQDSGFPIRSVRVDAFDLDQDAVKPSSPPLSFPSAPPAQAPKRPRIARAASSSGKPATSPPKGSAVKLRVLIVEDDPINRTILHKRLVTDGHVVLTTTNGQEAVQKIKADRDFDCILMDIQMPILNGFEASEQIRAFELSNPLPDSDRVSLQLNGRIPIFAVSASLVEKERNAMYKRGMDGWILKPIDFRRLKILMTGITDMAQRERDLYKTGNWEAGGWLAKHFSRIPSPNSRLSI